MILHSRRAVVPGGAERQKRMRPGSSKAREREGRRKSSLTLQGATLGDADQIGHPLDLVYYRTDPAPHIHVPHAFAVAADSYTPGED